jgi:hypothetical protein
MHGKRLLLIPLKKNNEKPLFLSSLLIAALPSFSQITTAQNGLSQPNASTVQLGGALLQHTSIDLGSSYNLSILKGSNNYFSILNNGNVGIGTAIPATRLDVNGGTQINLNSGELFKIKMAGSQNWDRGLDFNITDADGVSNSFGLRMTGYNNEGNRIISVAPYNTHGVVFNGSFNFQNRLNVSGGLIGSYHHDLELWLEANTLNPAETGIRFYTQHNPANPLMSIMQGGNVGIGTAAPQSKLAVNGDITAKKVRVTPNGWADYVFDPTYILRPLPELEQFINRQHHLPEVPTTAEVEKDGIDVGGNQALLLKKIEELTLYVIELNKQVQLQKDEIARLKGSGANK